MSTKYSEFLEGYNKFKFIIETHRITDIKEYRLINCKDGIWGEINIAGYELKASRPKIQDELNLPALIQYRDMNPMGTASFESIVFDIDPRFDDICDLIDALFVKMLKFAAKGL